MVKLKWKNYFKMVKLALKMVKLIQRFNRVSGSEIAGYSPSFHKRSSVVITHYNHPSASPRHRGKPVPMSVLRKGIDPLSYNIRTSVL
jgi:hypothetical protein